jgi:hypothetical protein
MGESAEVLGNQGGLNRRRARRDLSPLAGVNNESAGGSLRAGWFQFFRGRGGAIRKNMWGSTQRGTLATRDCPSRVARPSNRAFSSRRLSRQFFDTPIFRLLQQNWSEPAANRPSARTGNRCKELPAGRAEVLSITSSKITRLYQRPTGTEGNIWRRPTCAVAFQAQ